MRGIDGIGNWVLLIMAAASLISMVAALSLNGIISNDLTSYGLRFSYGWAIPYWNTIGTVIAMAWVNIIVAIVFQVYRIRTVRKEEAQSAKEQPTNMLSWAEEQEDADSEDGNRKVYGISIVTNQTAMQEEAAAEEQPQIVPYEPETCEQTET
jgi:uncharacterized membrane protein